MKNRESIDKRFFEVTDITIRLGFLFLLIAWCIALLFPFAGVMLWGTILAIAISPLHARLSRKLGNNPKRAALIIALTGVVVIVFPAWMFMDSLVHGISELNAGLDAGTLSVSEPSEQIKEWPIIGEKFYVIWSEAASNLDGFINHYYDQLSGYVSSFVDGLMSVGSSVLKLIVSMVIAGFLLASPSGQKTAQKFFRRIAGNQGDEFVTIISQTVGNVVKGVLGVAFIQSLLIGIGLVLMGVPYAGVWTLLVLILAILQLPVLFITVPVIIWLYAHMSPLGASLWTIYIIAASTSDNILKPILLGKGASVPMLVIFLGVIGGFMLSGFIGLFTGAIMVSIGYKLFLTWLNPEEGNDDETTVVSVNEG